MDDTRVPARSFGTRVAFALTLAGIVAVLGANGVLDRLRTDASAAVQQTLESTGALSGLLSAVQDAETGQRGFLLTHERRYLTPYEAARVEVPARLAALRQALGPEGSRTETLARLAAAKLAELRDTVDAGLAGRWDEAVERVDRGDGRALMEAFRAEVDGVTAERLAALRTLGERQRTLGAWATAGTFAGAVLLLGLALVTAASSRRDWIRLREALATRERTLDYQERAIGILSHDLRSPLAATQVSLGRVLRGWDGSDGPRRIAESAQRALGRAIRIVESLLDLTHARLGHGLPVEVAPADLADVVRAVLSESAEEAARRTRLEVHGATAGVFDATRLGQVAQNLVSNAAKYGDPGANITVVVDGRDPDWLQLSVHNLGEPIPEPLQPLVFDPFHRGDRESVARHESLGLGLYIVREAARAHGGDVRVSSTAAQGTTFLVRVPRGGERPLPGESVASQGTSPAKDPSAGTQGPVRRAMGASGPMPV